MGFEFKITNLATNEYWRSSYLLGFFGDTGTLRFPLSAGDYELQWGSIIQTHGDTSHTDLNFTITPEPASIVFLGATMLLPRRRLN